jgi:hypothetical protein
MAFTQVDIKTTFDRVSGFIVIEDITDYAGQGVVLGTTPAEGFLKVEYNTGGGWITIYYNLPGPTPDINPPSFYINQFDINIPLSGGLPLNANYRVSYLVNITGTFESASNQFEYEYYFRDPEICIQTTLDCQCSKITSVDVTNYNVDYATVNLITRAHTLYPPPASGWTPLTANVVTLVYTPIVTKTWTSEIVSTVEYLQDNGLYVTVELSGSKEIDAVCDTNLGKILCCLTQIDKTYNNYLCKSPVKAENYAQMVVQPTWRYITLFLAAQTAGDQTKAAAAYQHIIDYSGCGDCKCNDGPELVTGCGSGAGGGSSMVYAVESQDGSIDVTQNVVGNTTTFNIEVSTALQNIINNLGNAIDVVGVAPEITVTSAGTNPKVFSVAYTGAEPHTNQIIQKQLVIEPPSGSPGNFMDLTVYEIANQGPNVPTAPHTYKLGFISPNTSSDFALVYISNFITAPLSKRYIANATINKLVGNSNVPLGPPAGASSLIGQAQNIRVEVFHSYTASTSGLVVLRFIDPQGNPYNLAALSLFMNGNPLTVSLDIIMEP